MEHQALGEDGVGGSMETVHRVRDMRDEENAEGDDKSEPAVDPPQYDPGMGLRP